MSDDDSKEARRAILSRRAKFVAVAMAGIACGKTTGTADSGAGPPQMCLNIQPIEIDAGSPVEPPPPTSTNTTSTTPDAASTSTTPHTKDAGIVRKCLSPKPCLKMRPKSDPDEPF